MGILGNTASYTKGDYKFPFSPFTGYTTNIPKPDKEVSTANEANESNKTSQESPINVEKGRATGLGKAAAGGSAVGKKLTPANTCEDTTLTNIDEILSNLIKDIQEKQGKLSEYQDKIDEAAEAIKASLSWLVGEIMKRINEFFVGDPDDPTKPGIIPTALNALYTTIYTPLVPTAGPAAAHITASQALEALVIPISALEAALICVTNALLEGLVTLIRELLLSMLENIERFVTCIVDQFVGSLLNSVAMDINQSFDSIFNVVNTAGALANDAINTIQGVPTDLQELTGGITDVVDIFNGDSLLEGRTGDFGKCLTTYPSSCGSAQIKIFGGGGIGGSAIPILGPTVERIINDTSIGQNVNRTANVIGAVLENAGSGYRFPPFVEITDECGIGYGAKARSTINKEGDEVRDNFGNSYSPTIEDGRIISVSPINNVEAPDLVSIRIDSETGLGAVLKPILGKIDGSTSQEIDGSTSQEEVIQVIDCIS